MSLKIPKTNDFSKYFNLNKYIKFFRKYPRLQNLLKFKNKKFRLLLINFYLFFVKKNHNLKYFFFDNTDKNDKIHFNLEDIYKSKENIFKSLAHNGIVIIKNVLTIKERQEILTYFHEIENKNLVSEWLNKDIIDASLIKYKDNSKVFISYAHKELNLLSELKDIINIITKRVFGKTVKSTSEFFIHDCVEKETKYLYDDTNFHIDRYLPCLKIIYAPEGIKTSDAPFGFVKKSHKLNNKFMRDFILNTEKFYINDNDLTNDIKENVIEAVCPENSLIITFTNGLHKRNIFTKNNNVRKTIFFQFTKNFNTFSLINYRKYN